MSERLQVTSKELAEKFATRLNRSDIFDVATSFVPAIVDTVRTKTGLCLDRDKRALLATVAFTTENEATAGENQTLVPLIVLATDGLRDHPDMANNVSRYYNAKAVGYLSLLLWDQPSGHIAVGFPNPFKDENHKALTSYDAMLKAFLPYTAHIPNVTFVSYGEPNSVLLRGGEVIRELQAA